MLRNRLGQPTGAAVYVTVAVFSAGGCGVGFVTVVDLQAAERRPRVVGGGATFEHVAQSGQRSTANASTMAWPSARAARAWRAS